MSCKENINITLIYSIFFCLQMNLKVSCRLCFLSLPLSVALSLSIYRYAVHKGYWKDDYIQYFAKVGERKAPEISRGKF